RWKARTRTVNRSDLQSDPAGGASGAPPALPAPRAPTASRAHTRPPQPPVLHSPPSGNCRFRLVSRIMSAEAAARIESEVRELVRRRGVEPLRDVEAVRAMVDEALAQWEERALG